MYFTYYLCINIVTHESVSELRDIGSKIYKVYVIFLPLEYDESGVE